MSSLLSNADALLVAVSMLGVTFAVFFRLDEIYSKPKTPPEFGHSLSHWDEDGEAVCIEPDGKRHRKPARPAKTKLR